MEMMKWMQNMIPSETPRNARLYLTGLVFSGLGDGIIMAVAQLYFIAAGFSSTDFGSLFMLKAIGTALVTIPAGYIADRVGKRRVLIVGFVMFSIGISALLFTKNIGMLRVAMFFIGLADSTYVVLGPLYSSYFSHDDMDRAFGLRGFLNIISISIGSLLGFIPPILVNQLGLEYVDAYWIMFAIATLFFIIRLPFFILAAKSFNGHLIGKKITIKKDSIQLVRNFVIITFLATLGYEVFFSYFPLFLNIKFNAESDALGLLFSMSWAASAISNMVSPRISSRIGTVNTITLAFILSVPFYLGMALAPTLSILSLLYLIRRAVANLASPLTSSLMMKLLSEEEKATASGINMTTQKLGSALATWLGGALITKFSINASIICGTILYAVYAIAIYFLFNRVEASLAFQQREVIIHD
jgi:MFS family permease